MVDLAAVGAGSGMDFPLAERPRLRSIEIFPMQDRGQRALVLRDPADPQISPIVVSDGAADILMLLNGQRTVTELTSALVLRGSAVSQTQLRSFLGLLDEGGFLEGPRAAHRFEQRRSAFVAQPVRPAIHAGGAYPDDPAHLVRTLEAGYLHQDGPGALPAARAEVSAPRAVIAPHVDLHRGAPTYSWAYKVLGEARPAELYVILGTCHTPVTGHFAATSKPYATPLSAVPADADFIDNLGRTWGRDLFAGEFAHAGEHSIEFQAVYLRSLGLAGDGSAPIVPILCNSLHNLVPYDQSPRDVGLVADFMDALQQTLAADGRRTTLIAAVDLAHVGQRFGDRWQVDRLHQESIGRADHEMLELILEPDADAYYAQVMRDRDARRICGLTPIYLLTALMQAEQRHGELLRYTQWVDTDQNSSVTFASAVFA
ncbi:MAG: AmmeMemoRadiSam system protein B [Chloroflexi bacterium]|nr:AmmeMemoRadiSam system protein B [Chloroflexota bacterium]